MRHLEVSRKARPLDGRNPYGRRIRGKRYGGGKARRVLVPVGPRIDSMRQPPDGLGWAFLIPLITAAVQMGVKYVKARKAKKAQKKADQKLKSETAKLKAEVQANQAKGVLPLVKSAGVGAAGGVGLVTLAAIGVGAYVLLSKKSRRR